MGNNSENPPILLFEVVFYNVLDVNKAKTGKNKQKSPLFRGLWKQILIPASPS
jgi:hypothetical protein